MNADSGDRYWAHRPSALAPWGRSPDKHVGATWGNTSSRRRLAATVCLLAWLMSGLNLLATDAPGVTSLGAISQGLHAPAAVAVDAAGNMYVVEPAAGQVVVLDAFGRVAAVQAGFGRPLAIAVDSAGRIYLSEEEKGCVSVFDSQWHLLYRLGQGNGEFALPSHLAVESTSGRAYVCDSKANQIKIYQGGQSVQVFGGYGSLSGRFDFPAGVYLSASGEVFVVDQNNDRVQVFDRNGAFKRYFALGASDTDGSLGTSRSGRSQGITGDAAGRIFVADAFQSFIRVFDQQGNALCTIGAYGQGQGQLRSPSGLAITPTGQLLVAAANNGRLEVFGLDSFVQLTAVPPQQVVAAGSSARFSVAVSGAGPFTYQWRRGTNALSEGGSVTGSTSATLVLSALSTNDSGTYSVKVAAPSGVFTSPGAVLTVLNPPAILTQPAGQTLLAGSPALFSVSAQGDALAFQWQHDDLDIPGATNSSLSLPSVLPSDAGRYAAMVSNPVGKAVSLPAVLAVITPPGQPIVDSLSFQPDNTAQLFFRVDAGYSYAVEVSDDLQNWVTLTNVFGETGGIEFTDLDAPSHPQHFYRLRWAP